VADETFMLKALELARSGLGRTWPNPSVGCIILQNDQIIAAERTNDGGRPHAENLALEAAEELAKGATVYVTLEPCAHHGRTPPCAEGLVKAGVAEVIIGCTDPDSRVSGQGIEILKAAGIKVTTGMLEKECREMNKGFFTVIEKSRPYIMLKAAVSADYKYLPGDGKPHWVTGEAARSDVHQLRAEYDAILSGTGTVLADNPRLDVRLPGKENSSPVKIIVGNREIPDDANIWKGKEVWLYPEFSPTELAQRGITRLMVEAGPKLSSALLKNGIVDEVIIYKSAQVLGDKGIDFFDENVLESFKETKKQIIGDDLKIILSK